MHSKCAYSHSRIMRYTRDDLATRRFKFLLWYANAACVCFFLSLSLSLRLSQSYTFKTRFAWLACSLSFRIIFYIDLLPSVTAQLCAYTFLSILGEFHRPLNIFLTASLRPAMKLIITRVRMIIQFRARNISLAKLDFANVNLSLVLRVCLIHPLFEFDSEDLIRIKFREKFFFSWSSIYHEEQNINVNLQCS